MSKPDGGSAFPALRLRHWSELGETHHAKAPEFYQQADGGMTLRDYFAAKALPLAWEIECKSPTGPYSKHMEPTFAGAATRAYYFADAMLKERETQR